MRSITRLQVHGLVADLTGNSQLAGSMVEVAKIPPPPQNCSPRHFQILVEFVPCNLLVMLSLYHCKPIQSTGDGWQNPLHYQTHWVASTLAQVCSAQALFLGCARTIDPRVPTSDRGSSWGKCQMGKVEVTGGECAYVSERRPRDQL